MSVAKKIVLSVGFLVVMFGAYGFYANHSGSTLNENTVSVFKWAMFLTWAAKCRRSRPTGASMS